MSNNKDLSREIIEKVMRQIDLNKKETIDFFLKIIKFKTASPDPSDKFFATEIKDCIEFFEKTFDEMGLHRKKWLAKPRTFEEHPVLFGALQGRGGGSSIALNGHIDVVPVGDLSSWSHDPWGGEYQKGKYGDVVPLI